MEIEPLKLEQIKPGAAYWVCGKASGIMAPVRLKEGSFFLLDYYSRYHFLVEIPEPKLLMNLKTIGSNLHSCLHRLVHVIESERMEPQIYPDLEMTDLQWWKDIINECKKAIRAAEVRGPKNNGN